MDLGRRTFLKLGAGVVAAGAGYAGYEEVNGGRWLFDPATVTAARNKYFGLIDYSTVYEVQSEYAEEPDSGSADIDPEDIDRVAAVGSGSISGDNGVPTALFSTAVTGTFDAGDVEDPASDADLVEERDEQFKGYTLWDAPLGEQAVSGSVPSGNGPQLTPTQPGPNRQAGSEFEDLLQPDSAGIATRDGAAVAGVLSAPESDMESMEVVRTMIRAKDGGVGHPDFLTADDDYGSIRSEFSSDPSFLFGALLEPATVTLASATYQIVLSTVGSVGGPAGGGAAEAAGQLIETWFENLRGFAIGGTFDTDAERTTVKAFLTYSTEDAARSTGIVQLVDAASTASDAREEANLDARYNGRSIVVEGEGDTEELFEQAEQSGSVRAGLQQA